ncbi:heparan-sulfate 6-O-sulfotransferase 3-B [Corythoichthys intestinalis]|uniref:heparan-sulfate 6-O-sulfotransferase 3-B n=1 Tax=Corythoichthys intestinalis TaxID=161448 RepID=UPI0025A61B40|nr:heparan-sulfate 6-O-sulfotransferase 3-B [Corythoichthys intestinalis]XP_061799415.1 heparan-sulfate 6-O-sulfotransferase 3-B [Nerophis lumbriciformis]
MKTKPIMDDKSGKLILVPILAVLFVTIGYQYICPAGGHSCPLKNGDAPRGVSLLSVGYQDGDDFADQDLEDDSPAKLPSQFNFTQRDLDRRVEFNMKGDDVIVFLHIQKTGGTTFGRHLVRNIRLEQPCDCKAGQKKCTCHRPGKDESWLFSRFSTGWSCGLHADWTELTNCVPVIMDKKEVQRNKRNFYYITMLRDPVSRYLSEWKHVQRGATWKTALHMCDGRSPTQDELPTCYDGEDWSGVTLSDFMRCSSNLANNRQVRMLSDLSLVGCYNLSSMNESQRDHILLSSAMNNLKNMAFYGLTEFQRKTQYLFERTFSLRFISPFTQINSTRAANVDLSEPVRRRIEELNFLDVQLYEYAKDLFLQRFQFSRQRERREVRLKRREERRWIRERQQAGRQSPAQKDNTDFVGTTEDYTSQVARW